ncbi:unnamed protein product [Microthlaspi erraticum]|uniref:Uncharacterized protein n=1 Tax=Microthlaspi erraticum TaxID=1685480 RepID=A0A6D2I9C0_9BRAS|nr:unnamed protein product [Microthlaspi erraticum]
MYGIAVLVSTDLQLGLRPIYFCWMSFNLVSTICVERKSHAFESLLMATVTRIKGAHRTHAYDLAVKTRNYLSHKDLLETVQRMLEEAKSDNVSIDSLISLEEQLKTALSVTRARNTELMMELVKTLREKRRFNALAIKRLMHYC